MNNVHRSEYVEAMVALALEGQRLDAQGAVGPVGLRERVGGQDRGQAICGSPGVEGRRETELRSIRYSPFGPGYWDEDGDWVSKPGRHADLYVFAWHGDDKSTADHRDSRRWEFYVVAKRDLPEQKSIDPEGPSGSDVTVRYRRSRGSCGRRCRACGWASRLD